MKNKIKVLTSLALSTVMAFSFTACNKTNETNNDNPGSVATKNAASFVSLDINPSIDLTVDENDVVISAVGTNEDGQVVLLEVDVEGDDIETAVDEIIEEADDLGYISEENEVIETTVTSDDEEKAEELKNKIKAKIERKGDELNLELKMNCDGAFSLVREYEAFIEANPDYAGVLSLEKFKLAFSVSEASDEITLEVAVTMDVEDLIDTLKELHEKVGKHFTEGYKKAKKEAKRAYEMAIDVAVASAYEAFYLQNIETYPTTFYYGSVYKTYKLAEIALDNLNDKIEFVEDVEEVEIPADLLADVVTALGIEDTTVLANDDGIITIESIEDYLDIFFKNAEETDALEELEDVVDDILDAIEENLEENIDLTAVQEDIENAINEVKTALNLVKTTLSASAETVPAIADVVADIDSIIADIDEVIAIGVSVETLDELEELFEEKAEEWLEIIEEDLSEEDLDKVEDMIDRIEDDKHEVHKHDFEDALENAKNKERQRLENLRQERQGR